MTERPRPYLGISGVRELSGEDSLQCYMADQMAYNALDRGYDEGRYLLFGVKAVHKTQFLDVENKYGPKWYPVGEEFADALETPMHVDMAAAQICFDAEHVYDPVYRDEFMARICRRGRKWLNTVQFDMLPWHEDDTMLSFLEKTKQETGHTIILQAHGESMSRLGPEGVARRLGRYAHALDYVLFDASHGKGVRMDPGALLPYLDAGYESTELAGVGFGVAGGLCEEVVREDLPALLEKYRDLSWDAEGKLHGAYPDGTLGLDWTVAKRYLGASADVLRVLPKRTV